MSFAFSEAYSGLLGPTPHPSQHRGQAKNRQAQVRQGGPHCCGRPEPVPSLRYSRNRPWVSPRLVRDIVNNLHDAMLRTRPVSARDLPRVHAGTKDHLPLRLRDVFSCGRGGGGKHWLCESVAGGQHAFVLKRWPGSERNRGGRCHRSILDALIPGGVVTGWRRGETHLRQRNQILVD